MDMSSVKVFTVKNGYTIAETTIASLMTTCATEGKVGDWKIFSTFSEAREYVHKTEMKEKFGRQLDKLAYSDIVVLEEYINNFVVDHELECEHA